MRVVAADRSSRVGTVTRPELAHATRVAVAASLSWWLAIEAGLSSAPYIASLTCLMYMQPSCYDSFARALQRLVAVAFGVALAVGVFTLLGVNAIIVGAVIFVGLLSAAALRLGPAGSIQIAVSGFMVLAVSSANPAYPGQRVLETLLGVGVGLVVVLTATPPAVAPASRAAEAVANQTKLLLGTLSQILEQGWSRRSGDAAVDQAAALRDLSDDARIKIQRATDGLRLNPRARSALPSLDAARRKEDALHRVSRRAMTTVNLLHDGTIEEAAPMPNLSRLLGTSARVVDSYAAWCDSPDDLAVRARLDHDLEAADDAWSTAADVVEERWREQRARWLQFGMLLPLCGLVSSEVRNELVSSVQGRTSRPAGRFRRRM